MESSSKNGSKKSELITYDIKTPKGSKKDTSCPLPLSYSPSYVETCWYDWWVKEGFFKPEYNCDDSKDKFVIVIPPPNVTGSLHLGHMLTASIEDSIVRWNRMNGKATLWVPGCDHAGIATQSVIERRLFKEEGLTRHDLGRQNFLARVWDWKNQKGDRIYQQYERTGVSVDWDRECFTMGEKSSRAVIEAFIRLYEMGLIYRGNRLVNWSTALGSAISDVEVDKMELGGKTNLSVPGYEKKVPFGVIYYFRYKIEDSDESLIVATTRPETMLGDTAVAIHPEDPRYNSFAGKYVINTLTSPPRRIPIIMDSFVDREFGTGCVKITPGHDETDFQVGLRHNLAILTVIDLKGNMCGDVGEFKGMKRFEARKAVLDTLKSQGLYVEEKPHSMCLPRCSRSNDVIEPLLMPQWFVKSAEMSSRSIQAVKDGSINIIPAQFKETWYHWLSSGRDWCISRQLWWGHQIPAYRVVISGQFPEIDDDSCWVVGRTDEDALKNAKTKFPSVSPSEISIVRDEDVLDTWFSSALYPFSVMGWPENTDDMRNYYPTSLLETGSDILFFWVARMVMMSLTLLDVVPFTEVYFHSIIRDAQGRKMSKSLGNVIDPIDVITGITLKELNQQLLNGNLPENEMVVALAGQKQNFPNGIPECGTDALRFAMCAYTQQGSDINLDISRIQGYRFFCNKIWNAMKLSLSFIDGSEISEHLTQMGKFDFWILDRLARAVSDCNKGFATYNFSNATDACYRFWYYEYCDIYLEDIKLHIKNEESPRLPAIRSVAFFCVRNALLLLAPFMPFIVEELFQRLPLAPNAPPSSCVTPFPKTEDFSVWLNEEVSADIDDVVEFVGAARSLKSCFSDIKRGMGNVYAICSDNGEFYEGIGDDIKSLLSCESFQVVSTCPDGCVARYVKNGLSVALLVKGKVNISDEMDKLERRLSKTRGLLTSSINLTRVTNYEECVPELIRKQTRQKINVLKETIDQLSESMSHLSLIR